MPQDEALYKCLVLCVENPTLESLPDSKLWCLQGRTWSEATIPSCYDHTLVVAFQPLYITTPLSP